MIDTSLTKNSTSIQSAAIIALADLTKSYYDRPNRAEKNIQLIEKYLSASKEELWEFARIGYVSAIGALPDFILKLKLDEILLVLMAHSLTPSDRRNFFNENTVNSVNIVNWSEARRDSVKALINVIQTVGYNETQALSLFKNEKLLDRIFNCFLLALQEYTIDNRGDIGAWVREAAMNALYKLIVTLPHDHLNENKVDAIVGGLLQQAVEKIDRTRALAGKLFCKIVYQ